MRRAVATVAAMGLMLTAGTAIGQTLPPPVSPIASIEVSPRFWYLFESFGQTIRRSAPGTTISFNGDEYALAGASVSVRFNQLPETAFVLSGLYGTNDPLPQNTLQSAFPGFFSSTTTKTSRVDMEFLAQTTIPETSAAWLLGGRFEHHDSTGITTIFPSTVLPKGSSTTDVYTAKAGLTGAVPLTPDHNLRLFANAQINVGAAVGSPGSTFGVVGPDLAVGLQYAFSPTINADVRYRAAMNFLFDVPLAAQPFLPQYYIYQGPMVGINIKF